MKKRRRLSNNREGVSSELAKTSELTPHQAQISPSRVCQRSADSPGAGWDDFRYSTDTEGEVKELVTLSTCSPSEKNETHFEEFLN